MDQGGPFLSAGKAPGFGEQVVIQIDSGAHSDIHSC
jgi:hypothetical protein